MGGARLRLVGTRLRLGGVRLRTLETAETSKANTSSQLELEDAHYLENHIQGTVCVCGVYGVWCVCILCVCVCAALRCAPAAAHTHKFKGIMRWACLAEESRHIGQVSESTCVILPFLIYHVLWQVENV